MLKIDGNYLEGGGQIIRTALALSCLTKTPFEVTDIRKGRKQPGLKNQHLYCIKALKELYNADVSGAEPGSEKIIFSPKELNAKNLNIDIGTAGSITLLLQSLLLPCFFADKKIKLNIKGGTDTKWSMSFDYFKEVFIPQIKRFGEINIKLIRRGYYPKGGGEVEITTNPIYRQKDFSDFSGFLNYLRNENKKFNLTEQGDLIKIEGISNASKFLENKQVAERQAKTANLILERLKCPVDIKVEYNNALCPGSAISLWAIFSKTKDDVVNKVRIGSDNFGELGKKSEQVGQEAAEKLINEINSKAPVDSHLEDNLIPWLALFGGGIKVSKLTNHTKTNIYVVEKFLGKTFNVDEKNKIIETII